MLSLKSGMSKPVAVAKLLTEHGVGLRKAHLAIENIAAGKRHSVEIITNDIIALRCELMRLGVTSHLLSLPSVNAKQVREIYQLSQNDFAKHFCLDVKNVQNWEQRRYKLDSSTIILLAVIRDYPGIVENVLSIGSFPPCASIAGRLFDKYEQQTA